VTTASHAKSTWHRELATSTQMTISMLYLLHEVSHGAQPAGDPDPKDDNYADLYAHIKKLCPDPGKPK